MRRVLILEPDASLRAELARSVRAAGWEAVEARDGEETLRALQTRSSDVALLDLASAEDLTLLDRLRKCFPHVATIAMGSRPTFELGIRAMQRGACDFLRKPFGVSALEGALSAALTLEGGSVPTVQIVTRDASMERLLREARVAAATDATVLIVGESGTGKDLLARFVHLRSARRSGPFVAVNCAALPEPLAESELFGHERGAFTGAVEERPGQILAAHEGTLLLDEVNELAPRLQPKLLRTLQEREVVPVGAVAPRRVDTRFLATTQQDLGREVEAGRFRADLYYRLDVIVLRVPPLRERPADIPLLAERFLESAARMHDVETPRLPRSALAQLTAHPFPGNVRELENLMRRAAVLFPGREVDVSRLENRRPGTTARASRGRSSLNLRELERRTIIRSLAEFEGNRTLAARALGISVRTLRNKIHVYELA